MTSSGAFQPQPSSDSAMAEEWVRVRVSTAGAADGGGGQGMLSQRLGVQADLFEGGEFSTAHQELCVWGGAGCDTRSRAAVSPNNVRSVFPAGSLSDPRQNLPHPLLWDNLPPRLLPAPQGIAATSPGHPSPSLWPGVSAGLPPVVTPPAAVTIVTTTGLGLTGHVLCTSPVRGHRTPRPGTDNVWASLLHCHLLENARRANAVWVCKEF